MKKKIIISILSVIFILVILFINYGAETLYSRAVKSARKDAGLVKKSIQIEEYTIFYLEGGKGETILMLHGLGGNKDNWAKFSKSLTPNYHVIALDLPGSGESSMLATDVYNIKAQVKRLDKIINALKLNHFHLIGHAMGGTIAGKYAALTPASRILSLALVNTQGVKTPEKSAYEKQRALGKDPLAANTIEEFEALLKFLFIEPPKIPGFIKKYLLKQAITNRPNNIKIGTHVFEEDYYLTEDIGKITARTLILWGEKDNMVHVSATNILKNGLKNSEVIIMKDCGHLLTQQKPKEASRQYFKFLKVQ